MTSAAKFRPDEDDQLIELVRANPCLWNTADPDYKKEKRLIWADIGKQLTRRPRSGVECKSRWRSIRDYYKKQKKDEKGLSDQIPAIKRRQVYWNSLQFLDEVDDELNALSNVHVEISEDPNGLDPTDFQDSGEEVSLTMSCAKKRKLNKEELIGSSDEQEGLSKLVNPLNENECYKTADDCLDNISDRFECRLAEEKFKHPNEPRAIQEHDRKSISSDLDGMDDEIDLFFKAMAATVKKFPPNMKVISKAKIFSIVNELEIKHLELVNKFPNFMEFYK